MSADCGKLKNSNYFGRAHKGGFPKFGHISWNQELGLIQTVLFLEMRRNIIQYAGNP